jgi:hypothetical protein
VSLTGFQRRVCRTDRLPPAVPRGSAGRRRCAGGVRPHRAGAPPAGRDGRRPLDVGELHAGPREPADAALLGDAADVPVPRRPAGGGARRVLGSDRGRHPSIRHRGAAVCGLAAASHRIRRSPWRPDRGRDSVRAGRPTTSARRQETRVDRTMRAIRGSGCSASATASRPCSPPARRPGRFVRWPRRNGCCSTPRALAVRRMTRGELRREEAACGPAERIT